MLRQLVATSRPFCLPKLPATLCAAKFQGRIAAPLPSRQTCVRASAVEEATPAVDGASATQQRRRRRVRKSKPVLPSLPETAKTALQELLVELRAKRDELQAGDAVSDAALYRIAAFCFTNVGELRTVQMTQDAINKYGQAFLDVVKDFRANRDNGRLVPNKKLSVIDPILTLPSRQKLERFQKGENISQIAADPARPDLVVGDLAYWLAQGENVDHKRLAAESGVTKEVYQHITAAMERAGQDWISLVQVEAGPDVTVGQLRVVAALKAKNLSI